MPLASNLSTPEPVPTHAVPLGRPSAGSRSLVSPASSATFTKGSPPDAGGRVGRRAGCPARQSISRPVGHVGWVLAPTAVRRPATENH